MVVAGEKFAKATATCRVRAFLATKIHVRQRAQRRLDPNWDLALRNSSLPTRRVESGWGATRMRTGVLRLRFDLSALLRLRWLFSRSTTLLGLLIRDFGGADTAVVSLIGLRLGGSDVVNGTIARISEISDVPKSCVVEWKGKEIKNIGFENNEGNDRGDKRKRLI